MRSLGKYVLIVLIAFAIGAFSASKYFDNREPEVTVEYDTIIITERDSIPFKLIDQATVKVNPVKLTIPNNVISTTLVTDSVEIETSKYEGVERLSNGTIEWSIYADNLYATEFKLETQKEYVKETITKVLPPKSRLYLGGGADLDWATKAVQGAELGIMYNRRQKWQVGLNVRQDLSGLLPPNMATTAGFKVYIGL